jgi:lipoprotein-anchoring transpeptidase ErfK/SrfK
MARAANPSIVERRSARRAATQRKAVVISADAATPLVPGTATDISRDGVGIRAYASLPKGVAVDVEIEPRADSETDSLIRVSGYIARCENVGPHEFELGIHYRVQMPFRVVTALRPVHRRPLRPASAAITQSEETRQRSRLAHWLLVLAAVFLFLLWWPFVESDAKTEHRSDHRLAKHQEIPEQEAMPVTDGEGLRPPVRIPRSREYADLGPGALPGADGGATLGDGLDDLVGMGGPGEFAPFADDPESADPGPARRMDNDRYGSTPAVFANSGGAGRVIPAANRPGTGGGSDRNSRSQVMPGGLSPGQTNPTSVHLEVDSDAFEMTVYVDGDVLWRFPVGLGKDDSTPTGSFTIYNKIAQPDWYHRGETVPYGHSRNPLGESWMGLAANGNPLSYGIHPTNQPDSIGTASGAGCVRMNPEDAERLFRYCPIGATVRIASNQ